MKTIEELRADVAAAERQFEEARHGKNAFIGSSAWNDYAFARAELEAARACLAKATEGGASI